MSRLESHRNKQFAKSLFFTFILLVFLIIFIFFIGIKALLSISVFIANLTAKKQVVTTQDVNNDFFGSIHHGNPHIRRIMSQKFLYMTTELSG